MKKTLIFFLTAFMTIAAYGARVSVQPRGGGGRENSGGNDGKDGGGGFNGNGGGDAGGRGVSRMGAPVVIKMQRQSVPRPDRIRNREHIIRHQDRIAWPEHEENGARITQQPAVSPPHNHVSVVHDRAIVRNITHERRVEVVPDRYYWHTVDGMRYAHYYDRRLHWYGFYHGPNFYWTTYYGDRWWWFDPRFDRWVYWWDGFWWWPGPTGVAYVYVDNNYYPYDEAGVVVKKPEVEAPPEAVPSAVEGSSLKSPDGRRMVQIFGNPSEAFLYDTSSGKSTFLKYLGQGVDKVRYAGGTDGKPLQILVDYKDGTFALFTGDGDPVDADASQIPAPPANPPSAPPASSPPPSPPSEQ